MFVMESILKCPYAYLHMFASSLPHEPGNWRQAPAWQNITRLCKFCFEMVAIVHTV